MSGTIFLTLGSKTVPDTVPRLSGQEYDRSELKISFLNPTDVGRMFNLRNIGQTGLENLLRHVRDKLGVKNAYVFGPIHDCTVGCGQLIADYA